MDSSLQEKASKETRNLKLKVEQLEKENAALKKSLYELSTRFNHLAHKSVPFSLDSVDLITPAPVIETSKQGEEFTTASSRESGTFKDGRQFGLKFDLKGHSGAVYAVEFSPCGKLLASGSFDKTVRIWDAMSTQKELYCLKNHTLNVSDLSWSRDSAELLSGGYDQCCKVWDAEGGKLVGSYAMDGFVQCVMFNPSDRNIFFSGTSRNALCMVDRRQPDSAHVFRNDSMVNSLYVYQDGLSVLSGDASGYLKVWDTRTGICIQSTLNEPSKKPISHVTVCYGDTEDEPRYLTVNSYDNVLRVYDRGYAPPLSPHRLIHALKGYKNKNWPIKSSFHRLKEGKSVNRGTQDEPYGTGKSDPSPTTDSLLPSSDQTSSSKSETNMLIATGSADPFIYVYSAGTAEGTGELLQRIEGHSDRVYAVNFHPTEPILASCSADFSVKVWVLNGKKKKS